MMIIALSFLFGLAIGSFLNVVIWRLPQGLAITGRSFCPSCKTQLAWYDLLPVVSYVVQGGKCRYCNKPISPRYALIELATGLLFAGAAWQIMPQLGVDATLFVRALVVIVLCISIFIIDLEHYLILDAIVFPGMAAVLVSNIALDVLRHHPLHSGMTGEGVVGAVVAVIPFWLLWRVSDGKWMGFGDVKFVILMGLILGWPVIIVGLFLAFILGSVVGVGLMAAGKKQLSSRIPFGTFLTVATLVALFWGNSLWYGYRNLIGL